MDQETKVDELRAYPEYHFQEAASETWLSLCSSLSKYETECRNLLIDKSRKWEVASALQKSIRRADKPAALQVISGVANFPEEYGYFWRRMCVIACEDIGPADDTLVRFVIACSTLFPAKKLGAENHQVLCFLAEQMCGLPVRSRIVCSFEIVSLAVEKHALPELRPEEREILDAIARQKALIHAGNSPLHNWQKKLNWRTEGLLRFLGLALPLETKVRSEPPPRSGTIFDLPNYSYDMHTRIGLTVLRRLVQGIPGAQGIRDFFQQNKMNAPHRALGEALFYMEGGREKNELLYPALCRLEQRVAAHKFGLSFDRWLQLCDLTREALERGVLDRLREEVLCQQYGQKQLALVCQ